MSVVSSGPLFDFEGFSDCEGLLALLPHLLLIMRAEYPLAEAICLDVFERKARVFERNLVRIDRCAVRSLHDNGLRNGIRHPSKFLFVLPELHLRLL